MNRYHVLLFAALGLTVAHGQKFEGLALTPPMGWNTWNTFAQNINETLIKETADALVASGMRDAGYVYLVIDDTWAAKERDARGNLVPDPFCGSGSMGVVALALERRFTEGAPARRSRKRRLGA